MLEQDAAETTTGKKSFASAEKIIVSRSEKDEFISFLSTKVAEKSFRNAFLGTTHLGKARSLYRSSARSSFRNASRGLDHPATFATVVEKSLEGAVGVSEDDRAAFMKHWHVLVSNAKGSKKIVARREKESKNANRSNFRSKHKKHQSRH